MQATRTKFLIASIWAFVPYHIFKTMWGINFRISSHQPIPRNLSQKLMPWNRITSCITFSVVDSWNPTCINFFLASANIKVGFSPNLSIIFLIPIRIIFVASSGNNYIHHSDWVTISTSLIASSIIWSYNTHFSSFFSNLF